MRRLVLLFAAGALAATGCVMDLDDADIEIEEIEIDSIEQGLHNVQGLGEPINLDFDTSGFVSEVLVRLRRGLFRRHLIDRSSLDMTITSLNGNFHEHGTAIIPVNEVEVFSVEGRLVDAVVTWTEDTIPREVGDLYTVCSTLQIETRWGTWQGPERCRAFGPF